MAKHFCDNPVCESEAVTRVFVSEQAYADSKRWLCYSCSEVFAWGAQHGEARAAAGKSVESIEV